MLRRALLAASASTRIRDFLTTTPVANGVVARYVAGETADDALATARQLAGAGNLVSLDYLGEETTSPDQAAAVTQEYVALLRRLASAGLATDGRCEVSVKPTAVGLGLHDHGEKTAAENISLICSAARDAGTTVTLDMEDHSQVDATLRLVAGLRGEFGDLGCVIQANLRRSLGDCRVLTAAGSRVRLCKGAYRTPESIAYVSRPDVDCSYARCLAILLRGAGYPMLATHDPRLIELAGSQAALAGRGPGSFEYQMLYGIRPAEQQRLVAAGARIRVYVPYGTDWYGYLVRRLAERPANLALFMRSLTSRR